MKQLIAIAIFTLISCQTLSAQQITTKTKVDWDNPTTFVNRISYVSIKKDTLILPDDNLGKLILDSWKTTPKHEQPIIIFANAKTIKQKNEQLYASLKKKAALTKN